jgi:hypothetical protein
MEDRVPPLETEVSSSSNALNAPSVSLAEPTLLAGTKSWAEGVAFTALGLFYSESACCTRSIFGSFGGPHDDFPKEVSTLSFLQSTTRFQTAKTRNERAVENSKRVEARRVALPSQLRVVPVGMGFQGRANAPGHTLLALGFSRVA